MFGNTEEADMSGPTGSSTPVVTHRVTRRPNGRQRRLKLVTKDRLRMLAAPFSIGDLAEIPIIGMVFLAVVALLAVFVAGWLVGGLLIALIELVLVLVAGGLASLWAWLRGHPKMMVLDVDGARWVKAWEPGLSPERDAEMVRTGSTDPRSLGYFPPR